MEKKGRDWANYDTAIRALKNRGVIQEKHDTAKDKALHDSVMAWWRLTKKDTHRGRNLEQNIRWILAQQHISPCPETSEKPGK
ncbi:MAG: hypothetical protein ACYSYT_06400 [Planctomycetota bacterium]|jgi:macrodomain Ter protein organizer (MatP/YcbG family)